MDKKLIYSLKLKFDDLSKKIDDCINLLFKTSQAKYLNSKVEREAFKEQFSSCFLTT